MSRALRILAATVAFVALASTATAFFTGYEPSSLSLPVSWIAPEALPAPMPVINTTPIQEELPVLSGDTLSAVLARGGFEPDLHVGLVDAVSNAMDVRKMRAGTSFLITRTALREPQRVEYQIDRDHIMSIDLVASTQSEEAFAAEVAKIPSSQEVAPICATMQGSLFQSIADVGESPELAVRMADVFAWDLDFNTDPQNGDSFCLLVEKKIYENGQAPVYGKILAANYVNMGKAYDAYRFEDEQGKSVYYSGEGKSNQGAFLRSPLSFAARISSRFSLSRLHPVLKIRRPHLGIDYAAPTGTPVQSVSSGVVTFSGYSGGAGNLVKVSHSNGYETMYMHLSKRSVKKGQSIKQGQQIGLVGSTGLSTGPHLDFRIHKNGSYFNFETMNIPRESALQGDRLRQFQKQRNEYLSAMGSHPKMDKGVLAKYEGTRQKQGAGNQNNDSKRKPTT